MKEVDNATPALVVYNLLSALQSSAFSAARTSLLLALRGSEIRNSTLCTCGRGSPGSRVLCVGDITASQAKDGAPTHPEQRVEPAADGRLALLLQLGRRCLSARTQHQEQEELLGAAARGGSRHSCRLQHALNPLHTRALQLNCPQREQGRRWVRRSALM
jgi:hypothetical protein